MELTIDSTGTIGPIMFLCVRTLTMSLPYARRS